MNASSSSDQEMVDRLAEEFVERHRRGERPALARVHRAVPRARRGDPRPLPRPRADRAGQARRRRADRELRRGGRGRARGPPAGAAGRLPHPPRGRPRRHGRRLRGRAGDRSAGTWRSRSCPATPCSTPGSWPGSAARRGRRRGCTTPTSCRSSASASRTGCTTTSCSSSGARRSTRSSTSCGGCGGPGTVAVDGRSARRRRSPAHEASAAAVARSLLTGRFALHEPDPGATAARPRTASPRRRRPRTRADPARPTRFRRRQRQPPRSPRRRADLSSLSELRAAVLAGRGAGRRAGGRGAGLRPRPGRPPPRHQAVEPAARRRRATSGSPTSAWPRPSDGEDLTHTGDIVGTLRYMAPERFARPVRPAERRLRLGLTLYELLTLRPAFDAADRRAADPAGDAARAAAAAAARPGSPARPGDDRPEGDRTRSRPRRYPTAEELADDLQRFLEDRPIRARRVSSAERLLRWGRRNKARGRPAREPGRDAGRRLHRQHVAVDPGRGQAAREATLPSSWPATSTPPT